MKIHKPDKCFITLIILVVFLAVHSSAAVAQDAAAFSKTPAIPGFTLSPDRGIFLVLSDIHFDPFSDPVLARKLASHPVERWEDDFHSSSAAGFSQYGADTNYPLLVAVLKAAQDYGVKQHYDYVIVTGDYLAHEFKKQYQQLIGNDEAAFQAFVIKTMIFISRTIQASFPSLPVFGILGNNDSVCGDYRLRPGSIFLDRMAKEWKGVASDKEAYRDFAAGGFYAAPHPTVPNHELLILNSTFWSASYNDACSPIPTDPGSAELGWLTWKLYLLQLKKKTATLIMHIPPGIDAYNSSRSGACGPAISLWNPKYATNFLQIIATFKSILRDGYAGHMHMDDFRVIRDLAGKPFFEIHSVPAISPNYNNNPSFEIGIYRRSDAGLVDYAVIYLANLASFKDAKSAVLPSWLIEYSVNSEYHIPEYGPEAAMKIAVAIRSDENMRSQYLRFYNVQSAKPASVTTNNWLSYSCAQTELTQEAFSQCSCKNTGHDTKPDR
ncbi:MAG: metallophosphoesterase [Acidobacteriia bacterium]|nr:metallophosphoesterase [Terriglobia bacterium]